MQNPNCMLESQVILQSFNFFFGRWIYSTMVVNACVIMFGTWTDSKYLSTREIKEILIRIHVILGPLSVHQGDLLKIKGFTSTYHYQQIFCFIQMTSFLDILLHFLWVKVSFELLLSCKVSFPQGT